MTDPIVRRGYLTLQRNHGGRFPLSTLSSKRMWMILCRKGPSGKPRIEMYRSEDCVGGQPVRMIDLESVSSVQPVERKKGFVLELPDETMMLQCTSKADMEDWVRDTNRLRMTGGYSSTGQGQDIYDGVPDDETFRVNLRPSNAISFSGPCYLEIHRDLNINIFHIALMTKDEPSRLIVKWQIDHIRQYGSNYSAFKFQSGGKSPTGVGWFTVETEAGAAQRIHKAVDYWAKYIVNQIRNTPRHLEHSRSLPPQVQQSPPHTSELSQSMDPSYAPLQPPMMDDASFYQPILPGAGGGRGRRRGGGRVVGAGGGTASSTGSNGVYQPLGTKDAPSNYTTVPIGYQGQGGGAAARGSPPPPSNEATYMGLRPDTMQPNNSGTYAVPERRA